MLFSVACAPYCLQRSGFSFYPQQSKVLASGGISSTGPLGMQRMFDGMQSSEHPDCNREVLTLFPLHPTGILKEKTTHQVPSLASTSVVAVDEDGHLGNQPFFNFFTTEPRSRE